MKYLLQKVSFLLQHLKFRIFNEIKNESRVIIFNARAYEVTLNRKLSIYHNQLFKFQIFPKPPRQL